MPMSPEIYEVVSQGARYWFLFLMVVIVWRSYRWLARDRKQRKKRLRLLPDAGFIGELVVQTGNEELSPGTVFPVPREGTLGSSRGCDLCVLFPGISRKHLWFRYEDGVGLRVRPFGSIDKIQVDGLTCENRRRGLLMLHGSRLALGEGVLRLRMFAGFETTAHAAPMEASVLSEEPEESASQDAGGQPVAAMTPAQLALWQAQQQQYWAMAAQSIAAEIAVQAAQAMPNRSYPPLEEEDFEEEELREPEAALEEDWEEDFQESPPSQSASRYEAAPEAPQVFYPPVQDEDGDPGEEKGGEPWPYAPYPQSDTVFESHGYTYPELVEAGSEDEDLTDAAAPPKSLYLEPDEAEQAKKLLWDRYLGGGKKR